MRYLLIAFSMLLLPVSLAQAQISVNVGINMPVYPELVPVPGYPVYYAPHASSNYFFYDGMYWAYWEDNWYASGWYNGPWQPVAPMEVPLFVLRVPVRYYRQPPMYFRGWRDDGPPRWGEHWGHDWEDHRRGWDRWDRRAVPHAAPLPVYQRAYSGDRYPHEAEQRHSIQSEHYHYQPHEAVSRQHFQQLHNTGSSRAQPQQPIRERSSVHQQPVQPHQQPQHLQPAQPQHAQPAQRPQHPQTAPHNTGRENRHEEHGEEHR